MSRDIEQKDNHKPTGMVGFTIVWLGQLVSMLGSGLTGFAIMIWLWKTTGQATPFAIYGFSMSIPLIIASPLVGALVDRWDRKLTIAISDLAAGASTVITLILYSTGSLEVWHLYILGAFSGFFGAFQFPAFSAAITMMVSKDNYARASGMNSMSRMAAGILSPILGATLLEIIGLKGIFIIDIITFTAAVGVLFLIHIPSPPVSKEGLDGVGSVWKESIYGFKYLFDRKSLLSLLAVFLVMNTALSFSNVLRTPMILARTGNNEWALGIVNSLSTIGGMVSALILMIWGGPRRKIKALFASMAMLGVGAILLGLGDGIIIWSVAGFVTIFVSVIAGASSQAFWQAKVAPDVQGRVFAARTMISRSARPLAMVISGPLVDNFFEPMMTNSTPLSRTFGWLTGIETGAGFSLLFILTGVIAVLVAVIGYMFRTIRDAETILPDHQAISAE